MKKNYLICLERQVNISAEVAKTFDREKVIDSGAVKLEFNVMVITNTLEGNKFETKLHIRVLPVKGKKMWLAWTGFEQNPVEKETMMAFGISMKTRTN